MEAWKENSNNDEVIEFIIYYELKHLGKSDSLLLLLLLFYEK